MQSRGLTHSKEGMSTQKENPMQKRHLIPNLAYPIDRILVGQLSTVLFEAGQESLGYSHVLPGSTYYASDLTNLLKHPLSMYLTTEEHLALNKQNPATGNNSHHQCTCSTD